MMSFGDICANVLHFSNELPSALHVMSWIETNDLGNSSDSLCSKQ
jgi:hypothetical protein